MAETEKNILISKENHICTISLNRPKVLNALNHELMLQLTETLESLDTDDSVRVIIITGNDRAFAAGADIKEMLGENTISILLTDNLAIWGKIRNIKKPIIAAVSGFALGGGCELAMSCDIIIASESAQFGQPEINIGVIPGAGGTQRLTRLVGKHKAMEMILTGATINAKEAEAIGLVNKVVPIELYLQEARTLAENIAKKPPVAVRLAKESILKSFDSTLAEGLSYERKNFYILFSSLDQKEGMNAFLEKREPNFKGG